MIWSLYATLGFNMWYTELPEVPFEDEAWKILVDKAVENGFPASMPVARPDANPDR